MIDRFGAVPKELETLLKMINLKIEAGNSGVASIVGGIDAITVKFEDKRQVAIKAKGIPQEKWIGLIRDTFKPRK
jgi:transcription-repair coupling factor (superfamily II helicase)